MDNIIIHSAESLQLEPVGTYSGMGAPDSVLAGQMVLAGCPCHVQAVAIAVSETGQFTAINPAYQGDIETLYKLSGEDSLKMATINGRPYAIMVFPQGT